MIPDPKAKRGEPDNRGRDWFIEWAKSHGVIETFWTNELASNPAFSGIKGLKGSKGFIKELGEVVSNKWSDNPTENFWSE